MAADRQLCAWPGCEAPAVARPVLVIDCASLGYPPARLPLEVAYCARHADHDDRAYVTDLGWHHLCVGFLGLGDCTLDRHALHVDMVSLDARRHG